jgi:hypothetical protein
MKAKLKGYILMVEAEYSNESWKTTLGSQNPNQNQQSENQNKNPLILSPELDEEGVVVDKDEDE